MSAKFLTDLVPSGYIGTTLFHIVTWFNTATNIHRNIGYSSADQATVDRQLNAILAFGKGIDPSRLGVMIDWYGPSHNGEPWIDQATLMLLHGCESRGMKFSLCFDQGIGGGQVGMVAAFQAAQSKYFPSAAYLHDDAGKLLSIDFSASVDWNAILAQFPSCRVLHWTDDPVNGYAWIKVPNADPIGTMVSDNKKVFMPCACAGFDDHKVDNPSQSAWGGAARTAPYRNGQSWLDSWASIPASAKFIQVVTLNDHEERTGILFNLGMPNPPSDLVLPVGDVIPNVLSATTTPPVVTPPSTIPPSNSTSVITAWVTAIYQKYLGRNPEAGVIANVIQRGVMQDQFDAEIAASAEAKQYAVAHPTTTVPPVVTLPVVTPPAALSRRRAERRKVIP